MTDAFARAEAEATSAQQAAADPAASAWVSANAGAGKTRVLIDRVTRLLVAGEDPARILCLTYTRAAAAEMRNRLFARLGEFATMSDSRLAQALRDLGAGDVSEGRREEARALFARALETPGGLKIETIHAFAQRLIAHFPLEAGVAPGSAVADDALQNELLAEARDALLADPALSDAIDVLSESLGDDGFTGLTAQIGAQRAAFAFAMRQGLETAETRLYAVLNVAPGTTPEAVEAAALAGIPVAEMRRAAQALARGGKSDVKLGSALANALSASPIRFAAYADVFVAPSTGEPRARMMTNARAAADPDALALLEAERDRVYDAVVARAAAAQARSTLALLRYADRLLDGYARLKAAHGLLDYEDLIARTEGLLAGPGATPWVLFKLDMGLGHILVDEAQDTAPAQWSIVEALADEFFAGAGAHEGALARTMFAVGDEKQSIYSFQGASPGSFTEKQAAFARRAADAQQEFRPEELRASFRSAPAILTAVDAVFARPDLRQAATAADAPIRHQPTRAGPGAVEVWPIVKDEASDEPEPFTQPVDAVHGKPGAALLAEHLAAAIRGWTGTLRLPSQKNRLLQPRDVLILVRKRAPMADALVRALKVAGVPVAGADRLKLTDHIAVQDLLAVARACLLPSDDLSLAEALKSPLFAFDDDDLFAIAYGRRGTLWDALHAAETGHARSARAVLADARRRASGPPYEFFAALLASGGRARMLARLGPDAADPLDELLAQALAFESACPPSLQRFVDRLETADVQVKRDMEQGLNAVRVMTVHGAKGLEAPVVILADTTRTPKTADPWVRSGDVLLWPSAKDDRIDALRDARASSDAERMREYWRLLYVAMTRAQDRLVVCGAIGKRVEDANCWYTAINAALGPLGTSCDTPLGPGFRITDPDVGAQESPTPEPDGAVAPVPAWARTPASAETAARRALEPSRLGARDHPRPGLSPRESQRRFGRGRLIHKLLQVLPDAPADRRIATGRAILARAARDLSDAEREALLVETLEVLHMPELAALFGPGSRAEAAVAGVIPGLAAPIAGSVDRLHAGPDVVTVVDFKTNRPPPKRPEDADPAYLVQMALYRAALRAVFPGRAVRCALIWTDGPRAMVLPDPLLDAAFGDAVALAVPEA